MLILLLIIMMIITITAITIPKIVVFVNTINYSKPYNRSDNNKNNDQDSARGRTKGPNQNGPRQPESTASLLHSEPPSALRPPLSGTYCKGPPRGRPNQGHPILTHRKVEGAAGCTTERGKNHNDPFKLPLLAIVRLCFAVQTQQFASV